MLGHVTGFFLLRRELLSVLSSVYRFAEEIGDRRTRIWPSVAREMPLVYALLPCVVAVVDRPWCRVIVAADASLSGYGIVE